MMRSWKKWGDWQLVYSMQSTQGTCYVSEFRREVKDGMPTSTQKETILWHLYVMQKSSGSKNRSLMLYVSVVSSACTAEKIFHWGSGFYSTENPS